MQFTPKTQKQLDEERLLPEAEYPFEISGAEEKTSKKGNEMIELTVRVFKPDGTFELVTDYIMEAMPYKLLHCCETTGLKDKYNSGDLTADEFICKSGHLKLIIQPEGDWPAKNSVKDYISSKDASGRDPNKPVPVKAKPAAADLDDDIPF